MCIWYGIFMKNMNYIEEYEYVILFRFFNMLHFLFSRSRKFVLPGDDANCCGCGDDDPSYKLEQKMRRPWLKFVVAL